MVNVLANYCVSNYCVLTACSQFSCQWPCSSKFGIVVTLPPLVSRVEAHSSHTGLSLLDVMQIRRPNVVILNPKYDLFLNLTKQLWGLNLTKLQLSDNFINSPNVKILKNM